MKTTKEQISAFEATRQAKQARMKALMEASGEKGETLNEADSQEYDTLEGELKQIDGHLTRLHALEKMNIEKAQVIDPASGTDPVRAQSVRAGEGIRVKANVEKGIPFARYVKAMAIAKGNVFSALAYAEANKLWSDTTPQVAMVLKTAVAAGDTTTSTWADDLVYNQNLVADFIEVLRPQTIIGRVPGLRRVPFNVRVASATSGSTAYWVGEGKPIPVSKMATDNVTLSMAKATGLVALTKELIMSSAPSAEAMVRDDLARAIAQFLDVRFIDPNFGFVTGTSPSSLTYGLTPTTPTGVDAEALRADVQTLFSTWITNNLDVSGGVWVMSPTTALAISMMMNGLGQQEFPGLSMSGGTFIGLPVIVSQSAYIAGSPDFANIIVLINAPEIMLADEGGVTIDASDSASIEMIDGGSSMTATGTSAGAQLVSMFQTESVAIKAVRHINWAKRRSTAVVYLRTAAYTGVTS